VLGMDKSPLGLLDDVEAGDSREGEEIGEC
jgi:hypothetical protein